MEKVKVKVEVEVEVEVSENTKEEKHMKLLPSLQKKGG